MLLSTSANPWSWQPASAFYSAQAPPFSLFKTAPAVILLNTAWSHDHSCDKSSSLSAVTISNSYSFSVTLPLLKHYATHTFLFLNHRPGPTSTLPLMFQIPSAFLYSSQVLQLFHFKLQPAPACTVLLHSTQCKCYSNLVNEPLVAMQQHNNLHWSWFCLFWPILLAQLWLILQSKHSVCLQLDKLSVINDMEMLMCTRVMSTRCCLKTGSCVLQAHLSHCPPGQTW